MLLLIEIQAPKVDIVIRRHIFRRAARLARGRAFSVPEIELPGTVSGICSFPQL